MSEAERGDELRRLLLGPRSADSLVRARQLAKEFTSCPACGAEPWVNIDCSLCEVMAGLGEDE
jgi:hypothetical protein